MATSKKSLASRAGSAVRRAVRGRGSAAEADGTANGTATAEPAEKSAPAKKAPAKKTSPAKKTAPAAKKTATSKKAAAKKAPAKKTSPAEKAASKTAPAAKKTATKKAAPSTTDAAKKTAASRTASTKKAAPTTKKAAPTKKTATAKKTAATTKAPPAKRAAKQGAAGTPSAAGGRGPGALVVREGESPWTEAELEEVRVHLRGDVERLEAELEQADTGLHDLMIDSGDGSGPDPADLGSSSFERDHEISIANNARDMLEQSRHALERIEDGSYGVCERNGEPIGKLRLMAFPRATLCMPCKQREERH